MCVSTTTQICFLLGMPSFGYMRWGKNSHKKFNYSIETDSKKLWPKLRVGHM